MLLVTLILIWVSSHFLSRWLNCSTRFSFWTTTASTLRSYGRDFDNRQLLAHFYHSYLLFPFLSSQRFFSFSSLTKAGSRRYILPENIRNSRIRFAVGYKHLSLEVYLTMSMHVMISYGPLYSCCQALPKILDICQNVQLLFLRVCSIPSIISMFCVLLPCCLCLLQFIIIGNTWLNNPVLECQIVWF